MNHPFGDFPKAGEEEEREQECWRALLFLFMMDKRRDFVKVLEYSLYFCRKQMI